MKTSVTGFESSYGNGRLKWLGGAFRDSLCPGVVRLRASR